VVGVFALYYGMDYAINRLPEHHRDKVRPFAFVGPAVVLLTIFLVYPAINTVVLSLQDQRSENFVGFDNYTAVFSNSDTLVALRNSIAWVIVVPLASVVIGLAFAVLSDRLGRKTEALSKTFIFMPMAISFVGAGIIWRFMYLARPQGRPQTGVLNFLWVGLGNLSAGESTAGVIVTVVLVVGIVFLGFLAFRAWKAEQNTVAIGSLITALPFVWLLWRFLGDGIGGLARDAETGGAVVLDGALVGEPIIFLQEQPWNTFWLILVLIWIQTGFAMVVFSAAIKGVPTDLIEASKVDGATENETFWRVTIPQIAPTIGVVTTTLIVLVMKVFDIPKVMTNGQFGTNVLANEMWQKAFTELNIGAGAALAMILFFSVLPVMYYNIRRQREAV
jgi:alpha-glucoside transport system permease protein